MGLQSDEVKPGATSVSPKSECMHVLSMRKEFTVILLNFTCLQLGRKTGLRQVNWNVNLAYLLVRSLARFLVSGPFHVLRIPLSALPFKDT